MHMSVPVCARRSGTWLVAASKVHISFPSRVEGGVEGGWSSEMAVSYGPMRHFCISSQTASLPLAHPFCSFANYYTSTMGRHEASAVGIQTSAICLYPLSVGTVGLNGMGRETLYC